jgi:hypothetical protein
MLEAIAKCNVAPGQLYWSRDIHRNGWAVTLTEEQTHDAALRTCLDDEVQRRGLADSLAIEEVPPPPPATVSN